MKSGELDNIRNEFRKVWPTLIRDIRDHEQFIDIVDSSEWFTKVLEENVPFGKQNRALLLINMYNLLVPEHSKEEDFLSYVFGWMIEIMQASCLLFDDMMDNSMTRRGQPCWYKQPKVGNSAINDALFLENVIYFLAKKYGGKKEYYTRLLDFVHDSILQTIYGQSLDTRLPMEHSLHSFDEKRYAAIVKYKTSLYTFYGPIALAMIRAGQPDEAMESIKYISLRIGYFFQVQDDYLDCYGNPKITGKLGTDIQDGKCTWLVVKALELASPEQRKLLEESYGRKKEVCIETVKEIYDELDLPLIYSEYEDRTYAEIKEEIKLLPESIPQKPVLQALDELYRREK